MAVVKPVFMRPIEITTPAAFHFRIRLDDGGGLQSHSVTMDTGVWGSVFNLAAGIAAEITATEATWTATASMVESGDNLLIRFVLVDSGATGTAPKATWNELYDIIGASAGSEDAETWTESPANTWTSTMTYRPSYMWIPIYQTAEQGRFYLRQADLFRGNMSLSGNIGGNIAGPDIYWRDMTFVNETAENLYEEAATHSLMPQRSLEHFAQECRLSYPSVSGNPSTKGFYFFPDWTDLQTTCSELTTDAGGIQFDYSSGADTHVFCHMDIPGPGAFAPSLPTTRTRYQTAFSFHTISYTPSWTYYSV